MKANRKGSLLVRVRAGLRRSWLVPVVAAAMLSASSPAFGYSEPTHLQMVDMAYQIMRFAGRVVIPPIGTVSKETPDVTAFREAMKAAVEFWRNQPASLFQPTDPCGANLVIGPNMKDVNVALTHFWKLGGGCADLQDDVGYVPGGVFNPLDTGMGPRDHTGTVLGFWAQDIDAQWDDSHLWYRPTSGGGSGFFKDIINDGISHGIEIFLLPFLCLVALFTGSNCLDNAEAVADDLNVFDDLEGLIPGFGDVSDGNWTGVWHYLMLEGQTSLYDNHPGYFIEQSAPDTGMIDLMLTVLADVSGLGIDYGDSLGPKRYSITGGDLHPFTNTRSAGEWQFPTFAHLVFEPVDNLAFYGWQRWKDHQAQMISDTAAVGYPLHALGDAVAPHHIFGSPGWGHRPFEDTAIQRWLWLRQIRAADGSDEDELDIAVLNAIPAANSPERARQIAQINDIVHKALGYRKFILDWRAAHPNQGNEVPVRDLVTLVAQNAHTYVLGAKVPGWPWDDLASLIYLDTEEGAIKRYTEDGNYDDLTRPLMNEGMAAMIAFLTSAPEAVQ